MGALGARFLARLLKVIRRTGLGLDAVAPSSSFRARGVLVGGVLTARSVVIDATARAVKREV